MKFIDYLIANPQVAALLQQGLFSLLSTIFEALKWTGASKVLGTFTALDGGRVLRFAKKLVTWIALSRAASKASVLFLLVGLAGCAAAQPRPQVSVSSAVDVATWAVVLTDDALVAAAKVAPDTASLNRVEQAADMLEVARKDLAKGATTVAQVCDALEQVEQVATLVDCAPCAKSAKAALTVICGGTQ